METEKYSSPRNANNSFNNYCAHSNFKLSLLLDEVMFLLVVGLLFGILSCNNEKSTKIDLESTGKIALNDSTQTKTLVIGVAAMLSPENALPAYEEIVDYIGKKMNIKTKMKFTKDYASMNELVKTQKVAAAFVCSGPYVSGHDNWGMEIIVAPSLYGNTVYYSYVLANKNSNITKLEDLRGKKFAFTDPKSNTGRLVPTYELAKMGTTPEAFFSEHIFTGSHDKSIEAVAEKLVDGAAVDHLIWEFMNQTDSTFTSKTKIIEKLGPFCIPPFVTHPDCDAQVKQKIKEILLDMHNDPEGKAILDKIHIDKFVVVDNECYQSIREMNEWVNKEIK